MASKNNEVYNYLLDSFRSTIQAGNQFYGFTWIILFLDLLAKTKKTIPLDTLNVLCFLSDECLKKIDRSESFRKELELNVTSSAPLLSVTLLLEVLDRVKAEENPNEQMH